MKSYKILSLSLISFLIIGCASRSRTVKLNDGTGNIYTFKKEWISCWIPMPALTGSVCKGSAIKTNILGQSYVIEMPLKICTPNNMDRYSLLCKAARELGLYEDNP